jgi:hypothetical protein
VDFADDRGDAITLRLQPGQGRLIGFVESQRDAVARLLAELSGRTVNVRFEKPADDDPPADARRPISQQAKDQAMRLPLVRKVADLFDASLVDVREDPGAADEQDGV